MSAPYPHLVVRIYSAVYQREDIAIREGPPQVHIGYRSSSVQCPEPFMPDGQLSPSCRDLLIAGVVEAVPRLRFRMCLVWGPKQSTYVELDGTTFDSAGAPSGGLGSGGVGGRAMPVEVQYDKRETLTASPTTEDTP